MMRVARTALLAPVLVAGGLLTLTLTSVNVFAASSATTAHVAAPQSSSRPHEHERVDCSPGHVSANHGQCRVTFVDKKSKTEPHPSGGTVCFTVTPHKAGSVGTGAGNCAVIGANDKAFGTFTASGKVCGKVEIVATEPEKGEQSHHTTVTITCKTATTTAALVPAGSPFPPAGTGLLGVMGVGFALVTGYAIRTRRWVFPRRLATNPSA
jgi:hypothetical protein